MSKRASLKSRKDRPPRRSGGDFLSSTLSRREEILNEATRFFAEVGFSGTTTQLAERLGVTQPLLYKYFESKENLIKLCLENCYPVDRHHQRWRDLLSRRDRPIRDRLIDFYCDYSDLIFSRDFLRLALWSELTPSSIGPKFKNVVVTSIFALILNEIRAEHGLGPVESPTEEDLEIIYSLHGSVHHLNVRRWIGRWKNLAGDVHPHIALKVDLFLIGAVVLTKARSSRRGARSGLRRRTPIRER
jgi:AcrR family transcriptional regulator